ncbi:MAG: formate/nitrite transporter family protein [Saprospiraceae bacterium]|nr:formate/nitrite transporter family protein [Candidatus Opimibacter skivensis]
MNAIFGSDAFSPREIAEKVENIGVVKARLPLMPMIMLGILAGVFIGLGALYYVLIVSDPSLGFGMSRLLGGIVFSLGLIMVVVAGAELFTGNNLLMMAWADKKISFYEVLRNWVIVCIANFVGAAGLAVLVYLSRHHEMNGGLIGETYTRIASVKCNLSFQQAFFSGMLCNVLVCLAVWMSLAGRSVTDKVLVIIFPVSAFVAAGFEHSVANMYLIPMGLLMQLDSPVEAGAGIISWIGFIKNLIPVILGNLAGGSGFVALFYYFIYGHKRNVQRDLPGQE